MLQVLDAVSGALIGSFTWLNLGFVAPTLTYVYRRRLPVRLRTDTCLKQVLLYSTMTSCLLYIVSLNCASKTATGPLLLSRWCQGLPRCRADSCHTETAKHSAHLGMVGSLFNILDLNTPLVSNCKSHQLVKPVSVSNQTGW